MNKFITILSVLLFVTYANTTSKVSYSEIVNSLAEITRVQAGSELVKNIGADFKVSADKLIGFGKQLAKQCHAIINANEQKQKQTQAVIESVKKNTASLEKENVAATAAIAQGQKDIASQKAQAKAHKNNVAKEFQALNKRSLNLVQRARILKRLVNLIQDEMAGGQRTEKVSSFKVDNKLSKFTFAELHNEMKELDHPDAFIQSMMTTLIMITSKRTHFVNQKNVQRILGLIKNIMQKDRSSFESYKKSLDARVAAMKKARKGLEASIGAIYESIFERRAAIASNVMRIKQNKADVDNMEKILKRAGSRKEFNQNACKSQGALALRQKKFFEDGIAHINAIKRYFE